MLPDDLIPNGALSDEVRQLCEEHGIEFGALYAEARRKVSEASEKKRVAEDELLAIRRDAARGTKHSMISPRLRSPAYARTIEPPWVPTTPER